ncbi:hypothetical protein G6L37_06340 [Agrobacterium rubi]|nr:hypothetical protein [Agrobacterium rubi]NTF24981.1 hypothetical protein [Agrobacterium rubi]
MGIGVFSSDFRSTGGTFVVDGLVGGSEEYRKYVLGNVPSDAPTLEEWRTDIAEDPDAGEDDFQDYLFELGEEESLPEENWQQDQNDALVEDIEEVIKAAAKDLGMSREDTQNGRYPRASFDDDFVLSASGTYVDVGWRSWGHDLIVGVAASSYSRDWAADTEAYAGEIIDNTGLAPSRFQQIYGALSDAVQTYVRLSLMQAGHECSYRTSGYTTSIYEAPQEGYDAALEVLRKQIAELQASIPKSFHDGVTEASAEDREEIVHALLSRSTHHDTPVVIALFDPEQEQMVLFSNDRKRFVWSGELPAAFSDAVSETISQNDAWEDLIAIPRDAGYAKAWTALQSQHPDQFVVSMEEWISVVGGDPAIEWRDADGKEWEADVVMSSRTSAPTP